MNLRDELLTVLDALDAASIPYALCGGMALAIHGHPRFTSDIDLLIREEDLGSLESAVRPLGFDLTTGWIIFGRGTDDEQRIYRILKIEGTERLALDCLMVTPIQQEVWESRQVVSLGHRQIVVVSREGLIRMKRMTGRTQDAADIEKLEGKKDG